MFRRSNKLPQRKSFSLTSEQILEDLNDVSKKEEQRNQLYVCIEEKVPVQEVKFVRSEDFLRGTDDLEALAEALNEVGEELNVMEKELKLGSRNIKDLVQETLERRIKQDC